MAQVIGRAGPYTVVIIEGVRLPGYTAGGVNVSVGELTAIDHATVYPNKGSGAWGTSGPGFNFFVTSGSGNIVTIKIYGTGSLEAPAGMQTSSIPLALAAWGH